MKEYKISVKLNTMDMYRFLMRHEYGAFSGLLGLAVSILALISLLLGVGEGDRNTQILLLVVALLFTVVNPIRLFLRAQKQIVMNPTFHEPIEYTFGANGLHIAQGEVEMDVAWADMTKLVKGKKIMILYLSKMVGYIFPKSQCNGYYDAIGGMIQEQMALAKTAQIRSDAETSGKMPQGTNEEVRTGMTGADVSEKVSQTADTEAVQQGAAENAATEAADESADTAQNAQKQAQDLEKIRSAGRLRSTNPSVWEEILKETGVIDEDEEDQL